jgi:hypothetical protein
MLSFHSLKLEASLEQLKVGLDAKMSDLTANLNHLYSPLSLSSMDESKKLFVKIGAFKRKVFSPAESLLSKMLLYDDENYKTIFNIMLCVLLLWGLSIAFDDFCNHGYPKFDLLSWGIFNDLEIFFKSWFCLFISSFFVLFLAHAAAQTKNTFIFILIVIFYITFQFGLFVFSGYTVTGNFGKFQLAYVYMHICAC